jgi:hypothetical protein
MTGTESLNDIWQKACEINKTHSDNIKALLRMISFYMKAQNNKNDLCFQ